MGRSNAVEARPVERRDLLGTNVGKRIRAARQQRGLSLAQLGGEELSRSFLSLVETGRSRISLRALAIVAERLDLPISYFLEATDTAKVAELLLDQAEVAISQQDSAKALRLIEGDPVPDSQRPRLLLLRGWALAAGGNAREAVPVLRQALALAERADDHIALRRHLHLLGAALYRAGAFDEAAPVLRRAVDELSHEPRDDELLAKVIVNLGHISYVQGDVDQAMTHYARARELFGTLRDPATLGAIYSALSLAYQHKSDLTTAMHYSKLSVGAFRVKQNAREFALELNNMAMRFQELGDLEQAARCAQEAVERARESRAQDLEALARSTLAGIYSRQDNIEAAVAEAEAAEQLATGEDDLARVYAWSVLAQVAERDRDFERADALFRRALDALEAANQHLLYADTALSYSLALRERGEVDRALELALKCAQARARVPA